MTENEKQSGEHDEAVELIDIEEFSKINPEKSPPKAKKYRIRVDKKHFEVTTPSMTGRQILELAGKTPPERWMLNQKFRHGEIKPIGLDDIVDFTAPGIERFTTLPKDQTEGFRASRRHFVLPEEDVAALQAGGFKWETIQSGGTWLIVHDFDLPNCFTAKSTSVAISIPSGYPTAALDMAYFHPAITRKDGRHMPNTECSANIDGVSWQRWSRHYTSDNPWRPGEYNTVNHLHLIRTWLDREAAR